MWTTAPMGIDRDHPLLLASASPRRRELLERVGVPIVVQAVDVDESTIVGEGALAYLERIVQAKAAAAMALPQWARCAALLVADTAVVIDGAILGKPRSDAEAVAMLTRLADATHEVSTRFAIVADSVRHSATVSTEVTFRAFDEQQVERYVATGEGRDKAGGYGIQGIGAMLVRHIDGSYANVVGLPITAVVEALQSFGLIGALPVELVDG